MKPVKIGLALLLIWVLATACTLMSGGGLTSSTLDRIARRGILRVGSAADMPPLNMLNKAGVPMGLDVDLARDIAAAMGVRLKMVIKPFPELLPALRAGDVDMVISGMVITPERNMKAAFVGPYLVSGITLLTPFKSPVADADIANLNAEAFAYAALKNSAAASLVRQMMPKARLMTVNSYPAAVDLVLAGKADAMVADYRVCVLALLRHPNQGLVSRVTPLTYAPLGIALPKGDAQTINWVTNFLENLRESNGLVKLKAKWFEDASWLSDLK